MPIDNVEGVPTIKGFEGIFARVISVSLLLAGIVLFIMLLVGGFGYLTSGGDPKAVETAKKTLTSAILGLVVLILSYLILQLIGSFLGVSLTTFTIIGK